MGSHIWATSNRTHLDMFKCFREEMQWNSVNPVCRIKLAGMANGISRASHVLNRILCFTLPCKHFQPQMDISLEAHIELYVVIQSNLETL